MAIVTIIFGDLLVALGVFGYVLTGSQHPTALIPAGFGIALNVFGFLALVLPKVRMHVMHGAVLVGLFGFIGGLVALIPMKAGAPPAPPAATYSKLAMSGLMLIYVLQCVRSFMSARRSR